MGLIEKELGKIKEENEQQLRNEVGLATEEQFCQLKQEIGQLKQEIGQLKQENGQLWDEMSWILKKELGQLKQENGQLWAEMNLATQDAVLADEANIEASRNSWEAVIRMANETVFPKPIEWKAGSC
jgi:hypothetical protein